MTRLEKALLEAGERWDRARERVYAARRAVAIAEEYCLEPGELRRRWLRAEAAERLAFRHWDTIAPRVIGEGL